MKKVIRKVRTGSSARGRAALMQSLQEIKPVPLEPTVDMVDLAFAPHQRLESRSRSRTIENQAVEEDEQAPRAYTTENVSLFKDQVMSSTVGNQEAPQSAVKQEVKEQVHAEEQLHPPLPPRPAAGRHSRRYASRYDDTRYTHEVPYLPRNLYEDVGRFVREGLFAQVLLAEYPSGSLLAIRFFACIAIIAFYPMAGIMLFAILFGLEVLMDPRLNNNINGYPIRPPSSRRISRVCS